jgi:hypothetical protein
MTVFNDNELALIFFGAFLSMAILGVSMESYGDSMIRVMGIWNTAAFWLVGCLICISIIKIRDYFNSKQEE